MLMGKEPNSIQHLALALIGTPVTDPWILVVSHISLGKPLLELELLHLD